MLTRGTMPDESETRNTTNEDYSSTADSGRPVQNAELSQTGPRGARGPGGSPGGDAQSPQVRGGEIETETCLKLRNNIRRLAGWAHTIRGAVRCLR